MSGQTVADLTAQIAVDSICLLSPAAYSAAAFSLAFDEKFTKALRTPGSWSASPAFAAVREFTGAVMLVSAEYDDVIPTGVILGYEQAGQTNSRRFTHISIDDAPHALSKWLSSHTADRRLVIDEFMSGIGTDA